MKMSRGTVHTGARGVGELILPATLWLLVLLTLIGRPAPTSVGVVEVLLAATVIGVMLAMCVRVLLRRPLPISETHRSILAILGLYCLSFLGAFVVGVSQGVGIGDAFRASVPYLIFVPLVLAAPVLSARNLEPAIRGALTAVGTLQALYLIGLFIVVTPNLTDVQSLLLHRTTFLDSRTTVPLFLASCILPLHWMFDGRTFLVRGGSAVLVAASIAGALSTQTRSQVIAIACGVATYVTLRALLSVIHGGTSIARPIMKAALAIVVVTVVAGTAFMAVKPLRTMVETVVSRSGTDQDNGRIDDEWRPAVRRVLHAGLVNLALGIGAGERFITAGGEERPYVHNLVIYLLVFNGAVGLLMGGALYAVILIALLHGASKSGGQVLGAYAALLTALFVYAQFFAVHKLFSYNLMLALITIVALPPMQLRRLNSR